jgi:hypothetical protein
LQGPFKLNFQLLLITPFHHATSLDVEIPNSPSTTINNHEEDQLMADLEDVPLKSQYLIGSNQSEEVGYTKCMH